jgi:hypothetical protein
MCSERLKSLAAQRALGAKHGHHIVSGSTSEILTQNPYFNKPPSGVYTLETLKSTSPYRMI